MGVKHRAEQKGGEAPVRTEGGVPRAGVQLDPPSRGAGVHPTENLKIKIILTFSHFH